MNFVLKIKPLSVNEAFKGRRFKTDKYDAFIQKMFYILPKEIDIPDQTNIKLAIHILRNTNQFLFFNLLTSKNNIWVFKI